MNRDHPRVAKRIDAILSALQHGPLTVQEISERVYVCFDHAIRYMDFLQSEGQVYICAWKPRPTGRQHPIPRYALGKRRSVAKPARQSGNQRQAAYRDRVMSDEDRRDVYLARNRTHKLLVRVKSKPTTWLSALGVA